MTEPAGSLWRIMWRVALAAPVAVAVAACDQSVVRDAPTFPFLPGFQAPVPNAAMLLDNSAWWEGLQDPLLNDLIDHALDSNLALAASRERVERARAELRGLPGAATLESSIEAQVVGSGGASPAAQLNSDIGLSWMLDPYGAQRNRLRVAESRVGVAEAEADAAELLLLYNVANAYAELRYQQALVALDRAELRNQRETLALTRTLVASEEGTRLDVARAAARVAAIEAEIPGREAAVAAHLNEIAVLLGYAPGAMPEGMDQALRGGGSQPIPRLAADTGIPADLLRSRPDIRIAERQYYIALAELGVTRAARFPQLSLSGVVNLTTASSSGTGIEYYFGPAVQLPVLPLDAAAAAVTAREAALREAHVNWTATVLDAILEVENALLTFSSANRSVGAARNSARLYGEALELTRDIYRLDEATLSELIAAEQSAADARRILADLRRRHVLSFIALNVRLGTGRVTQPD